KEENTFDPDLRGFNRILRSAVIYGPNAAGKTNLLLALQMVQALVISSASATPGGSLPFTPFRFNGSGKDAPTQFEVTFVQHGVRYEYGFAYDATRIRKEWLIEHVHARGRTMFERIYSKRKYQWSFSSYFKGQRSVWSEATLPNALFLSTAVQLN